MQSTCPTLQTTGGTAAVALGGVGTRIVAAGAGNLTPKVGGSLIGPDGAS